MKKKSGGICSLEETFISHNVITNRYGFVAMNYNDYSYGCILVVFSIQNVVFGTSLDCVLLKLH